MCWSGLLSCSNPMIGDVDSIFLGLILREADQRMRSFRKSERAQMIEALHELIEEARKRVRSTHTLSRERARWTRLAGQLIWYKDQILRSMSLEALEEEAARIMEEIEKQRKEQMQQIPKIIPRRTILTLDDIRGRTSRPRNKGKDRSGTK